MRRLASLAAVGALWLFLAALPALADGGPHVSATNNGSSVLTADSCAGCHRAHTAQGQFLINAASEEALCLTCHGAQSAGATTDVLTGVQYTSGAQHNVPGGAGTQLGALRSGGFDQARIDAGNAARAALALPAEPAHPTVYTFAKKVGVGTPQDVTSAHLAMPGNGLTMPGIAWGNGAFSAAPDPGPTVTLSCASCHNPHGNGQYRILNPIPDPATGTIVMPGTGAVAVTDAALPPAGDTRNYTVIQAKAGGGRYLLAGEIVTDAIAPTAGDYWHQVVPWDAQVANPAITDSTVANHDAPNGIPSFYNGQINAWCSTCHSRYTQSTNLTQAGGVPVPGSAEVAGNLRTRVCQLQPDGSCSYTNTGQPMVTPTGDGIYDYRHTTSRNRACTTCHVAHGSNAEMVSGAYSSTFAYPNGATSASSRLLKVDGRGTCQVCHDPTITTQVGDYTGPVPTPGVP
ncbi:MAG: hypothetical protein A2Z32_01660 [Chloroflexi bacterium RBG_16_69_14]|nr:MAG: hypothetical protein A2Z32_01660 [Chloroflexi bacterium RBG_16_69_14]